MALLGMKMIIGDIINNKAGAINFGFIHLIMNEL